MNINEILQEIEKLPSEERLKLYSSLTSKIRKYEHITKVLDEFRGSGKGLWGMDAQEYVNSERANDRF